MIRLDSRIWFPIGSGLSTAVTLLSAPVLGMEPKSVWIPVISGAVGAVLFWFFEASTHELMKFDRFRLSFDFKRARFEGEWIEFYKDKNNEMLYAYFRIRHTGKDGEPYLIKGNAYDSNGHNYARWASKMVKFDGNKGIIDYFYFGYFFEKDYSVRGMANLGFDDRTRYVDLPRRRTEKKPYFYSSQFTTFNSGTGYFLDSSASGTEQTKFHFIKVDDILLDALFGTETIHDIDAERCLIVRFHEKFGERIKQKDYLTLGDTC